MNPFLIYVIMTDTDGTVMDEYRLVYAESFENAKEILSPEYGDMKTQFCNQTVISK